MLILANILSFLKILPSPYEHKLVLGTFCNNLFIDCILLKIGIITIENEHQLQTEDQELACPLGSPEKMNLNKKKHKPTIFIHFPTLTGRQ